MKEHGGFLKNKFEQYRHENSNSRNDFSFYETKVQSSRTQSQDSTDGLVGDRPIRRRSRRHANDTNYDHSHPRHRKSNSLRRNELENQENLATSSRPHSRRQTSTDEQKSKERREMSHLNLSKDHDELGGNLNVSSKSNRKQTSKKKMKKKHTGIGYSKPTSKQTLSTNVGSQDLKRESHRLDLRPVSTLENFHVFISCLPGLEPFLHNELISIGLQPLVDEKEKMSGKGGLDVKIFSSRDMHKCHLYLGTASHVFLRASPPFRALGMEELCLKISRLGFWRQYIPIKDNPPNLDIRVTSTKSRLFHTKGVSERVERGILNALGFDGQSILDTKLASPIPKGTEKSKENDHPIKIMVRIHRNEVDVSVDTSSNPLHRRGYRGEGGKAPLREDLAFALLYASGWRENVARTGQNGLMDPMCGSGTILIEGAAMALGMPPGRLRSAPFESSRLSNEKLWENLVSSALDNVSGNLDQSEVLCKNISSKNMILGSDRDKGVIDVASSNAERAGVLDFVSLEHAAISSNRWFENPISAPSSILIATNPPYGRRVSKSKGTKNSNLLPLYQTLGQRAGLFPGEVDLTILAQDMSLARRTAIADLKLQFASKHGGLNVFALGSKNVFLHGSLT